MPDHEPSPPTVGRFSFREEQKPASQLFPQGNFAEQQAEKGRKLRQSLTEQRQPVAALEMSDAVRWWQGVASQRPGEGDPRELIKHFATVLQSIGVLFTRAQQGSREAAGYLEGLIPMIVLNVGSVVVHGEGSISAQAAAALVNDCSKGVSYLEALAKSKPGPFLPQTQRALGIPMIISATPEGIKANAALVARLEVGTKSLLCLPTTKKGGKTMKLATGANLCAAHLILYLQGIKAQVEQKNHVQAAYARAATLGNDAINAFWRDAHTPKAHPDDYSPAWLQAAIDLKPFSSESWPSWFEVAWEVVIDVTEGKPETEPDLLKIGKSGANKPVSYRRKALEGTKISNVRTVTRIRLRNAFKGLAARDLSPDA